MLCETCVICGCPRSALAEQLVPEFTRPARNSLASAPIHLAMDINPYHPVRRDPRTCAIIGAAMEVHRELGPGFLEAVYQEAMARELAERDVPAEREVQMPVHYKGHLLGTPYRADFVCFGEVVVELKAQGHVGEVEEAQVINYLKAGRLETGLLINFGEPSLAFRRFAFTHNGCAKSAQSAAALA